MRRDFLFAQTMLLLLVALDSTAGRPSSRTERTPILLFTGQGTSAADVGAVERIVADNKLEFATATSSQLNRMSASQLTSYRLLLVPGGNFMDMSASLTPRTKQRIHDAVHGGVNYAWVFILRRPRRGDAN